jgi:hypothetical protein
MITAFHYITDNNVDLKLDLTRDFSARGVDLLLGIDNDTRMQFISARSRGIKWLAGEKEYRMYEEGRNLNGIMTPDFNKVVIVYPYDHPQFPSPGNAVIYNEDGSVYKQLTCPKPISELGKNRKINTNAKGSLNLFFGGVVWDRNERGDIVPAMNIGFDMEYFERRELDYITGEYGACLNSWRQ